MLFFVCSEAVESKLVKLETSRGKVILPPMTNDECSLNEPSFKDKRPKPFSFNLSVPGRELQLHGRMQGTGS